MQFDKFIAFIHYFVQPDEVQLAEFLSLITIEKYHKGEYLHKAGKVCQKIWFINQGIARHFFKTKEEEGTVWFSFANDLLTEMESFTQQKPANHNIIAVNELDVLCMRYSDLQKMYAKEAVWERFGRLSNEQYLIKLINRSYGLLFKSGKEKYEDFISQSPEILQNIPLHQIADFIGVSFETLSRIRAKKD
jgi:signal-transduction protein with cAMP-binding, CBS, and nucleotidyltransferase domain